MTKLSHLDDDGRARPTLVGDVLGFVATEMREGRQYWKDLCVVDLRLGGPTRPCEWLALDGPRRTAYLAGTDPGALAWRRRPRA
jgi:hypothetical protein